MFVLFLGSYLRHRPYRNVRVGLPIEVQATTFAPLFRACRHDWQSSSYLFMSIGFVGYTIESALIEKVADSAVSHAPHTFGIFAVALLLVIFRTLTADRVEIAPSCFSEFRERKPYFQPIGISVSEVYVTGGYLLAALRHLRLRFIIAIIFCGVEGIGLRRFVYSDIWHCILPNPILTNITPTLRSIGYRNNPIHSFTSHASPDIGNDIHF